jgi:methionyl-tRNA formyltransferase
MRLALFGSPAFALPVLEGLRQKHDLALVVAQPDKAAGRGMKRSAPAVAARARELGLRLEQPARLKGNEAFHVLLQELEVAITAAYGKILPKSLLEIPQHGFLNVHASLLPRYRGAAPIQWALIRGESETGVTIMQTEVGLDTGPIRLQRRLEIEPHETAPELSRRLSLLGAEALLEALHALEQGTLPLIPQDDREATHAPMLGKHDGRVRWEDPATAVYNRYRGVYGWPGSWTFYKDKLLKIHAMRPSLGHGNLGEVLAITEEGIEVAVGEGSVLLETVQPPNRAKMPARAWANGYGVRIGGYLG